MVVFGGSNGMRWMGRWGVFVGELLYDFGEIDTTTAAELADVFFVGCILSIIMFLINQFHKGCVFAEDLYHSRMHQFQDLQKIGPFEIGYESIAIPLDQSEGSRLR